MTAITTVHLWAFLLNSLLDSEKYWRLELESSSKIMSPTTFSYTEAGYFNRPNSQRLQAFIFLLTGSPVFYMLPFSKFSLVQDAHMYSWLRSVVVATAMVLIPWWCHEEESWPCTLRPSPSSKVRRELVLLCHIQLWEEGSSGAAYWSSTLNSQTKPLWLG